MERQIITDGEGREFLMKTFKCTRMQVWKALHFKSESYMARRIRSLALSRGGALIGEGVPSCETTHEEVDNTMTQTWGSRVKLVINKTNGVVKLFVDNELKRVVENPSIPEFMSLQKEVEVMAKAL